MSPLRTRGAQEKTRAQVIGGWVATQELWHPLWLPPLQDPSSVFYLQLGFSSGAITALSQLLYRVSEIGCYSGEEILKGLPGHNFLSSELTMGHSTAGRGSAHFLSEVLSKNLKNIYILIKYKLKFLIKKFLKLSFIWLH